MQYMLSKDFWANYCFYDLEQNVNVNLQADKNLKIKLSMQFISSPDDPTDYSELHITNSKGEIIQFTGSNVEIESGEITMTFTNKNSVILIGFQGESSYFH